MHPWVREMVTKRPITLEEVRAHALKLSKQILRWENAIQDARWDLVMMEETWGVEAPDMEGGDTNDSRKKGL